MLVDGTSFLEVGVAPGTGGTPQLTGAGALTLQAGSQSVGNGSDAEVLENVSNFIGGAGTIGNGDGLLALHNDGGGTIAATDANHTLLINTGALGLVDNH